MIIGDSFACLFHIENFGLRYPSKDTQRLKTYLNYLLHHIHFYLCQSCTCLTAFKLIMSINNMNIITPTNYLSLDVPSECHSLALFFFFFLSESSGEVSAFTKRYNRIPKSAILST